MNGLKRSVTLLSIALAAVLLLAAFPSLLNLAFAPPRNSVHKGPAISSVAMHSRFARDNNLGYVDLAKLVDVKSSSSTVSIPSSTIVANEDFNQRPQNEPSIAISPDDPDKWVAGANDYGIGVPIGSGTYVGTGTTRELTYFPPFPLLFATVTGSSNAVFPILEPPVGTGDPVLAFGKTRAAGGIAAGQTVVYKTSLGFSATFAENGIFLYRSLDGGRTWTRPVVPPLSPPKGLRTVVYYSDANNYNTFHDKEWMTVDNNELLPNGNLNPHFGRIYVTWTRFSFPLGQYAESPIMMAYSDDNGQTFSDPIEVSGSSAQYCRFQVNGPANECDENQFSVPVVAKDGTVYVAFENEQFNGSNDGYRDQYLVVKINPDTFAISGPFKVNPGTSGGTMIDGLNDYPINQDGRQTLCNSNFRVNSAGNIAYGGRPTETGLDILYVVWSDNRRHAGEFPNPTNVGNRASGYACPSGKFTDTDVFLSKSVDGGATWSSPVQVNNDKTSGATNNMDQWYPWVAVDPSTGRVDVVFHDRRYDGTSNKLARTSLARSTDGGSSFPSQSDIAGFASNFDDAFFNTGRFIGDYINLVVAPNGKARAVFTAVTPGKSDSDIFIFVEP